MDISEITKDVYIHCFDDDFNYPNVLNALNICAKRIIDKMKCCENCKHHDIEDYTCNIICSISGCNKKSKWELAE